MAGEIGDNRERFTGGRAMPKDARWGLVIGAGAVILIAVLFFRRDTGAGASVPPPSAPRSTSEMKPGLPRPEGIPTGRVHKVEDGETLTSIALRYYGDAGRVSLLFRANRDRLRAPDHVPYGTVLLVPEAP
jgi:hypothetical protein